VFRAVDVDLSERGPAEEPIDGTNDAEPPSTSVIVTVGRRLAAHFNQRRRLIGAGLITIAFIRIFAVGVAGIVGNDSFGYLSKARDPFGGGFVTQGYRQAAYPLFIAVSNRIGDWFGWDNIFGVALLQRSILIAAVAAAIWALRWWSIPVVTIATTETFIIHSDFLLPEGFLVPSSLLIASTAAAVTLGRVTTPRLAHAVLVGLCIATAACASIKLQYGLLVVLVLSSGSVLSGARLVSKRFAWAAVASVVVSLGALGTVQAFENQSELGVFEPVGERARAEWYGAWTALFRVHEENQSDPELAEFWDGGNLYTFLHGVEATVTDYPARAEIIRDRIDEMLETADTSANRQVFDAFIGGLAAGRHDDLRSITNQVLPAPNDPLVRLKWNRIGRSEGVIEVIDRYNYGTFPGIATFGPLLDPAQSLVRSHRGFKTPLAAVSIMAITISLFVAGRHRLFAGAALAVVVGSSAAMATAYIDNARYLLGPFMVGVVGGTVALRAVVTAPAIRDLARRWR
jgi:hypothetical protein